MFPSDDPDLAALVAERYENEREVDVTGERVGEVIAKLILLVAAVALVCLILGGVWLAALLLEGIARAV